MLFPSSFFPLISCMHIRVICVRYMAMMEERRHTENLTVCRLHSLSNSEYSKNSRIFLFIPQSFIFVVAIFHVCIILYILLCYCFDGMNLWRQNWVIFHFAILQCRYNFFSSQRVHIFPLVQSATNVHVVLTLRMYSIR